jgi:glycine cleavage system H lipoate-binding protein
VGQPAAGAVDENANGGEPRITRRAVDQLGDIIEITLNENGEIVSEELVGNVDSLPVEEEYVDEAGRVVSRVRDESGNAIERVFDDDGNMVGVRTV